MKIFLIAFEDEFQPLLQKHEFEVINNDLINNQLFYCRKLDCAFLVTGIGKTNAAISFSWLLTFLQQKVQDKTSLFYKKDFDFINLGFCCALSSKSQLFEAYQVVSCQYNDFDLTAFNYAHGQVPGFDSPDFNLDLIVDHQFLYAICFSADKFLEYKNNFQLPNLTKEQEQKYHICYDMEVAALTHSWYKFKHLNYLQNSKFSSIKIVSDVLDINSANKDQMKFNLDKLNEIILKIFEKIV